MYVLCVHVCVCKQSNLIIVKTFICLKDHDEAKMWEILFFVVFGVKNLNIYSVTRMGVGVCAQVCIGVLLALSVHLFVWSRVSPECGLTFSWLCCKSARGSNVLFSPPPESLSSRCLPYVLLLHSNGSTLHS